MKVKDSEGNTIPHLSKVNGSVISDDTDAYHKRLAQMRQRKRLEAIEQENKRLGDELSSISNKLDLLINLLKEK